MSLHTSRVQLGIDDSDVVVTVVPDSTRDLAAQSRPRITVHPRTSFPGPNAKRYCRSWLVKEYRLSGPVITPQMRCWWE